MDEPIADIGPPEIRRCAACGERASFGFGLPGSPVIDADVWYCGAHRREGERLWTARYRPSGGGPGVGGLLMH